VSRKVASPTALQLCSSLSVQSHCLSLQNADYIFMRYQTRLFFNNQIYFMFPVSVCILLKINLLAFRSFLFFATSS
jgi:hypothetical protein